ncbi:MAG TPA: Ig-like domain-containing protein [Chryseosolibacter sp.]
MLFKKLSPFLLGLTLLVCPIAFIACDDDEVKDTVAPDVAITNVTQGMMVINTLSISVDATDNVAVASVEFFLDNNLLTTDTESPYDFTWDSKTVNDGNHTIKVVATDNAQNTSEASVGVSVQNTHAPIPAFKNVTEGMMVINTITVQADASDNSQVTDVKLYAGAALVAVDAEKPYEFSWDSKTVADGNQVLKLIATDNSGNAGESSITVSVQNLTPPQVVIKNISEGLSVTNTLSVEAEASDNAGVQQVQLFVANTLIATDTETPYQFSWDSNLVADGSHLIKVVATDNSGNVAEKTVTVNVKNALVTITINAQHLDQDPEWLERGFIFLSDSEGKVIASQEYTNGSTVTLKSSTFTGDKFYLTEVLNERIGNGTDETRTRLWTYADVERGKNWVVLRDYEDPDDVYIGEANLSFTNVAADNVYLGKSEGDMDVYVDGPGITRSINLTRTPALLYMVKQALDNGSGTPLPAPTYYLYNNIVVGNNTLNLSLVSRALTKKVVDFPADATYSSVYVDGLPVANDFTRTIHSIHTLGTGTGYELYYPSSAFAGYYVETYYESPTVEYWRTTTATDFTVPTLNADVNFSSNAAGFAYTATGTDFLSASFNEGDENRWSIILPPTSSERVVPALELPSVLQGLVLPTFGVPSRYGVYDFEDITSYDGLHTFIRNSTFSVDELYDYGKDLIDIQYFGAAVNGRMKTNSKDRPFGRKPRK